jgi:hypothetical protein
MRLIKLALATLTIGLGVFCLTVAVIGVWGYADCRGSLGEFQGSDRTLIASACGRGVQIALWAMALAAAFGILAYFLLRSWRSHLAPVDSSSGGPTSTVKWWHFTPRPGELEFIWGILLGFGGIGQFIAGIGGHDRTKQGFALVEFAVAARLLWVANRKHQRARGERPE